jgi:DNA-binding XRE family transcriptional regulator
MVKFEYDKYLHEKQALRWYRRNPQFANFKNYQLLELIRSKYSPDYPPLIIGKTAAGTGEPDLHVPKSFMFNKRGQGDGRLRKVEQQADAGITNVRYFARDFVARVGQKRQELGLTQKDLAMKVNVPEATISALERGELPFDGELKGKLNVELAL